jgi:predicted alpha/beta superfamily hydrolase
MGEIKKNNFMKFYFLIAGCLLFLSTTSFAQTQGDSKPFVLGKTEQIHSTELKEIRKLNVYLPEGYSPDSASTYPVIYLLDGSANEDFIHIVGLVQFLTMIEKMPKAIVVGIANVDRKRDFTFPTTVKQDLIDFPTTGQSEKFIAFIEKELQPFIAEKYKTNASKTIIGQSLGGLLATEILLKKPQLFDNYIIISPSLWWNNESLLTDATKFIPNIKPDTKIYISVGEEGKQMISDAKKLADLIQMNKKLKTTFVPLMQETHLTILHNSAYKGLETVFSKKK